MPAITNRQVPAAIYNGDAFTNSNGTLRGTYIRHDWQLRRGQMPDAAWRRLIDDLDKATRYGAQFYVVYSYQTPIAWGMEGDLLTVPDVRYSVTTSRHQSLCLGGVVDGYYATTGERVALPTAA